MKGKHNNTLKKSSIKPIKIDSNFESGNIILKSIEQHDNKYQVNLEINKEPYNKETPKDQKRYENWLYFKADNIKSKNITFIVDNIKIIKDFWKGFNVAVSYDNKTWKRLPTKVNQKKRTLEWHLKTNTHSTVWFAYYPPYPFSKSRKLLPNMQTIGKTQDRNPLLMKTLGRGPTKVWLISGQHPGETVNSWILEGFVNRVNQKKSKLFEKYTFYIVPNANPDGNKRGNWYVSSKGINLNRDWDNFKSPETKAIKKQLDKYGYDLVFDIHGDEEAKHHFISSSYKNKHPLHNTINRKLNDKNPRFQMKDYYHRKTYNKKRNTLDDYTSGITIEAAMKHKLYNHKTLQAEVIQIGESLANILMEL